MSRETRDDTTVPKRRRPTRRGVLAAGVGAAATAALPPRAATAAVDWQPKFFTAEQGASLQVLCDLILPKTSTPSATEAGVHEYIDEALSVADPEEQLASLGGLAWLDDRARSSSFAALPAAEQVSLLEEISDDRQPSATTRTGAAFFADLKERVLFGYYTSKVGRQVLGKPDSVKREKLEGCAHGPGGHG